MKLNQRSVLRTVTLLGLLLLSSSAFAETLPDPTRPSVEGGFSAGFTGSGNSGELSANETTAQFVVAGRVLQSVMQSPEKNAAVIDGQEFLLGDKIGTAKLIQIEETCVVLQGPEGRRVLQLFTGVKSSKLEGGCQAKPVVKPIKPVAQNQPTAGKKRIAKKKRKKKPALICTPAPSEGSGK